MDLQQIIHQLRAERDRIDSAIRALEGGALSARGRRAVQNASAPTNGRTRRKRGPMSAAARKLISERMKKRWAERKAAAKK